MKKPKCPNCNKKKNVNEDFHDCPTCGCDVMFYCDKCGVEFDKNGDVF